MGDLSCRRLTRVRTFVEKWSARPKSPCCFLRGNIVIPYVVVLLAWLVHLSVSLNLYVFFSFCLFFSPIHFVRIMTFWRKFRVHEWYVNRISPCEVGDPLCFSTCFLSISFLVSSKFPFRKDEISQSFRCNLLTSLHFRLFNRASLSLLSPIDITVVQKGSFPISVRFHVSLSLPCLWRLSTRDLQNWLFLSLSFPGSDDDYHRKEELLMIFFAVKLAPQTFARLETKKYKTKSVMTPEWFSASLLPSSLICMHPWNKNNNRNPHVFVLFPSRFVSVFLMSDDNPDDYEMTFKCIEWRRGRNRFAWRNMSLLSRQSFTINVTCQCLDACLNSDHPL